jgi:cytochrome oxidase assembly protein ShyY1
VLRLAVAQVGSAIGTPSADAERRGRVARAVTLLIASTIILMFALGYWLLSRAPLP